MWVERVSCARELRERQTPKGQSPGGKRGDLSDSEQYFLQPMPSRALACMDRIASRADDSGQAGNLKRELLVVAIAEWMEAGNC